MSVYWSLVVLVVFKDVVKKDESCLMHHAT